MIWIITGEQGDGKSSLMEALAEIMANKGFVISGFISRGYWKNGVREKYDLIDLKSKNACSLIDSKYHPEWYKFRRFYFNPEILQTGNEILKSDHSKTADLVFIDEVGPLEIQGGGWAEGIRFLLEDENRNMCWSVRRSLISEATEHWNLKQFAVVDAAQADVGKAAAEMERQLIKPC